MTPRQRGKGGGGYGGGGNPGKIFIFCNERIQKRVGNLINILLLYYYQTFKILIMKGMS
jgi:hypothetical protein